MMGTAITRIICLNPPGRIENDNAGNCNDNGNGDGHASRSAPHAKSLRRCAVGGDQGTRFKSGKHCMWPGWLFYFWYFQAVVGKAHVRNEPTRSK